MTNFVEDDTALPFPKSDLVAIPAGADPSKYVTAEEWNSVCQGAKDIKGVLRAGKWLGLAVQSADPAPAGLTNYVWLKDDGKIYLTSNGIATALGSGSGGGGGVVDGKTITGAGTTLSPYVARQTYVNVKDHGAAGDGVTDDAPAINSAIAAAIAAHAEVYFPDGTYLLGSTIFVTATQLSFRGSGSATIRYSSTVQVGFDVVASSNTIAFRNLMFQGDDNDIKTVNFHGAILLETNVTDVIVEDCRFTQCSPLGVNDSQSTARLHFIRNYCHNCPGGINPPFDTTLQDCDFVADEVVTTRAHAVYCYGSYRNVTIDNCRFKNISEQDIQIRAATVRYNEKSSYRITNCHFENSHDYSIWIGSDDHPDVGGFVVTGNTFRNSANAIQAIGLRDLVLADNHFEFDWEFPYPLGTLGTACINVSGTVGIPGRYNTTRGVIIHDNKIIFKHPWVTQVTVGSLPLDGDTVTVGEFTYTWRKTPTVEGDVAIGADTRNAANNLVTTLRGVDGLMTAPNNVLRYATDVFNDYYGTINNLVVIVGFQTFATSQTGSQCLSFIGPTDYRQAVKYPIIVQNCIAPLIHDNHADEPPGAFVIEQNVRPHVHDNVITDYSGGVGVITGIANIRPTYRGNRVIELNPTRAFHGYFNSMSDWFPLVDDDYTNVVQQSTKYMMSRAGVVGIGDGKAYTLMYFGNEYATDASAITRPFRWDDGDEVKLNNGVSPTNFYFHRNSLGAGQFNDADSLLALINATGTWTAAYVPFESSLGGVNPKLAIRITHAAGGTAGNAHTLRITRYKKPSDTTTSVDVPQPLLTGQILCNLNANQNWATFYGGAAARTKTFVHTPIANPDRGVFVQGVDAASQALAPVVYQSDIIGGVGFYITHTVGAGTENFFFRVMN